MDVISRLKQVEKYKNRRGELVVENILVDLFERVEALEGKKDNARQRAADFENKESWERTDVCIPKNHEYRGVYG